MHFSIRPKIAFYVLQKGMLGKLVKNVEKTILESIVFKTITDIPKQLIACVMAESSQSEAFCWDIYECQSINFHMLCLDFMCYHYFKNYSGLVCVKRKQSYCRFQNTHDSYSCGIKKLSYLHQSIHRWSSKFHWRFSSYFWKVTLHLQTHAIS